jgi:hypothetical protein
MSAIQTSASFRGTFRQGGLGTIIMRIVELDGTVRDPEAITYEIVNDATSEQAVAAGSPLKAKAGLYMFDWGIPNDQSTGKYNVNWTFVIDGEEYNVTQSINVGDAVVDSSYSSYRLMLFRDSLELMIDWAQGVPVYTQPSRPSRDYRTFYFTMGRWNPTENTRIYQNGLIVESGFRIDYDKGAVIFDNALTDADRVEADYNFRWFSEDQLDRFLSNALGVYNSYAPHTGYSITTVPDKNIPAVLYGAAVDAIRNLMFSGIWQEPAKYFGGLDQAKSAIGSLDTLKKNYEETWKELLEQKKYFPYKGLHLAVVVPEYTLPGGRSRWFRYLFSGSGGAG